MLILYGISCPGFGGQSSAGNFSTLDHQILFQASLNEVQFICDDRDVIRAVGTVDVAIANGLGRA
jgi:hypothetical protein